jgi:4-amino-4-deoxy-L-arabinose transferase-like glycosyltransferase
VYGERGGLFSAVALVTSLGPYLFTRFLIPDTLLGLWLLLGFAFFLRTFEEDPPSRLSCWGIAVAAALAVLTKGLIGIVFPIAVIGLYLILTGNLRHLLKMRLLSSTLVFLLVAAPWHILAALHNPDQGPVRGFLWFYFMNEQVLRYLNKRVPRDYDTVPLALFWGLLVLWVLPWCTFLPQAIREAPTRLRDLRPHLDRCRAANLVFLLWALVIVMFFSFSTRQEYYTLPGIPAVALLIGGWLAKESESAPASAERRAGRISSAALFAVGAIACAAGMLVLLSSHLAASGTDLADLLRQHPQDYALSMGHFLDLTPQAMGVFRTPLLAFSLAFLIGTGLNLWLRRHGRPAAGNLALAVMMVVILSCVHEAFVTFSPILSSRELAVAIKKQYRPGDLIVVDGEYESACTLNFYTGVPLRVLHAPSSSLWYGSRFSDAPRVFETPESFASLWNGPKRIFLWSENEQPSVLQGKPSFLVARNGGKFILSNQRP